MRAILKGVVWVIFIICLFTVAVKAQPVGSQEYLEQLKEVADIIGDGDEVYKGQCVLGTKGVIAEKKDEGNRVVLCKVFSNDDEMFYVIVYNDDKSLNRVIKREKDGTQSIVWKPKKQGKEV